MAAKTWCSLFTITVLLAVSVAGRQVKSPGGVDIKQPEFWKSDHSFLIPGLGRVLVPPAFTNPFHFHNPPTGTGGQLPPGPPSGTGSSHIPGGDDTFVPNPGFEIPSPGGVPTTPPLA